MGISYTFQTLLSLFGKAEIQSVVKGGGQYLQHLHGVLRSDAPRCLPRGATAPTSHSHQGLVPGLQPGCLPLLLLTMVTNSLVLSLSPALAQHHRRAQVGQDASSLPADLQKQARGGDIFLLLYHQSNLDRKLLSAGVKCHSCTQPDAYLLTERAPVATDKSVISRKTSNGNNPTQEAGGMSPIPMQCTHESMTALELLQTALPMGEQNTKHTKYSRLLLLLLLLSLLLHITS